MLTVLNKLEKVIVLKSATEKPLRIFPGYNSVDLDNLDAYTDGNPAAQAVVAESLTVKGGVVKLSKENQAAADYAKQRNDDLNKSARLLKKANAELDKTSVENRELKAEMQALTVKMAEMAKTIESLTSKKTNKAML